MKIAIVDPLLYTAPYDEAISGALLNRGHDVRFFGRALASHEAWSAQIPYVPLGLGGARATGESTSTPRKTNAFRTLWRKALPAAWVARYLFRLLVLKRKLAAFQPDVIHFQWTPVPWLDRLVVPRLHRPAIRVLTVHDIVRFNGEGQRTTRDGEAHLLGCFDGLVVHTRTGLKRLVERGPSHSRIACIPHGILSVRPAAARSAEVGEAPSVTFLLFGQLKAYKGLDVLIRAVHLIPSHIRGTCRFVVAGTPHVDVDAMRALAQEYGIAELFDFRFRYIPEAEMDALFRAADVAVFPYREIDASGVLMMSLSYGVPIIASEIGIFKEVITNGKEGCLVPPDDPRALSDAISTLAQSDTLRHAMGSSAARLQSAVPSWDEIARLTEEFYETLSRRSPHSPGGLSPASQDRSRA